MTAPTTEDIRAVWAAEVEREFFERDGEAQFDAWLSGVVRKAQAEALREAARVFAEGEWAGAFMRGEVDDDVSAVQATDRWFNRRADRIEQNSEGNET